DFAALAPDLLSHPMVSPAALSAENGGVITRGASAVFVGRGPELDQASAALNRARGGKPEILLITGEAGIGKTRFVRELARVARESDFRVIVGGCLQLADGGIPFGAIIEALRDLPRELPPGELIRLAGSGRVELARLLPDLATNAESAADGGSYD